MPSVIGRALQVVGAGGLIIGLFVVLLEVVLLAAATPEPRAVTGSFAAGKTAAYGASNATEPRP